MLWDTAPRNCGVGPALGRSLDRRSPQICIKLKSFYDSLSLQTGACKQTIRTPEP